MVSFGNCYSWDNEGWQACARHSLFDSYILKRLVKVDKAWVYILQCADGSYYTGKTQNLELRIAQNVYWIHY